MCVFDGGLRSICGHTDRVFILFEQKSNLPRIRESLNAFNSKFTNGTLEK